MSWLFFQICIQNNPEEARQMLLQNPQLAYALLQAQVVMKIVDPVIAQVGCVRILGFGDFCYDLSVISKCFGGDVSIIIIIIFVHRVR